MLKVQFNNGHENPFAGMSNTLEIFQNASKGVISTSKLDLGWKECKTPEQKALFYSLLFSIGDVPRTHHLFDGKVNNGGFSQRVAFRDTILPWMNKNLPKSVDTQEFLYLIYQYTNLENILGSRVKTKKKSSTIESIVDMVSLFGVNEVAQFCARLYRSTSVTEKMSLAKYLTLPKHRKGMQDKTKEVHSVKTKLLRAFSDLVKLPYVSGSITNFYGYRAWRKQYNSDLESVVFSTGAIKNLDKEQFFKFVEALPSTARFRVTNKLRNEEKYPGKSAWLKEWEQYKLNNQAAQRKLEEKVAQGLASDEDLRKLQTVKIKGAVNKGASNIRDVILNVLTGKVVDTVQTQSIMDAINLQYNTLVFIDDSGSMNSGGYGNSVSPRALAAGIATVCLSKNPDTAARNLVGLFSYNTRVFSAIDIVEVRPNNLMRGQVQQVNKPLINPTKDFLHNFSEMKKFLDANSTGNGTNVASIADFVIKWVEKDPTAADQLKWYPVWTLISDGNFNNLGSASASLGQMFKVLENKIGFRPFIVLIDVDYSTSQKITNFTGLDGVMMVPPTPEAIEMFLCNFRDMDTYDVYTPLQSLARSDRYAPIRNLFGVVEEKTGSFKQRKETALS